MDTLEKFYAKTKFNPANDCIEWIRNKNVRGYGTVRFKGKMYQAHRAAYELSKGNIPDEQYVCHSCDNTSCVNVNHLWLGTPADNILDRDIKSRGKWNQGEKNVHSKLKESEIDSIRKLYEDGENQYQLAKKFKVNQSTISHIVNRKIWR